MKKTVRYCEDVEMADLNERGPVSVPCRAEGEDGDELEPVAGSTCGIMANKINRQNEGPRRWLISFLAKEVLVLVLGISFCVSVNGASMLYLQSYEAWRKHLDDRWGYLLQEEQLDESRQAAVWVGEFGTATDSEWWKFMTRYLSERPVAGWAYWPLNGDLLVKARVL
ncbi:unnamed protein product [Durusdinium trenchii]|uniref:Endoglucanase n=2 Tax=Durusdinium trenchii TaxID=1381693 RepID=A0ABP0JDF6_9DINO